MQVCDSQVKGEGGDGHCVEMNRQVPHLQADQPHHPWLVGALKKVRGPLGPWGHLPVVTALGACLGGSWGLSSPSPGVGGHSPPSPRLVQCHSCAHVVRAGGTVEPGMLARTRAPNWFLAFQCRHQQDTAVPLYSAPVLEIHSKCIEHLVEIKAIQGTPGCTKSRLRQQYETQCVDTKYVLESAHPWHWLCPRNVFAHYTLSVQCTALLSEKRSTLLDAPSLLCLQFVGIPSTSYTGILSLETKERQKWKETIRSSDIKVCLRCTTFCLRR